ncbi:MAG: hypothetical protein QF848_09630 [Planctomycetota bacterium]|nr:hypothetical protein [Planctomycetota bacterium]
MKTMKTRGASGSPGRQAGVALVYAVFGAFVAATMVAVMFTMAGVTRTRSQLNSTQVRADYMAQGAVEVAKKSIQTAIANWSTPPTSGTAVINGVSVPYTITATGGGSTVTDSAGIQTLITGYEIEALTQLDRVQTTAHRVINSESTPIFQFAVFYEGDLEAQPGPSMTLGGRVHSNGDMYLGCGNTLTMDTNYVHALGRIYRSRKNNTNSNGTVEVRQWVENPFDPLEPVSYLDMNSKSQMDPVTTESGYDSNFTDGYDINGDGDFTDEDEWLPFVAGALEMWDAPDGYALTGNTMLTGDHGVSEAVTPNIGSIQMYEPSSVGDYYFDSTLNEYSYRGPGAGTHAKGYYHQSAGLSVIISEDTSEIRVYDELGGTVPVIDLNGALSMTTIYDARQGGDVDLLSVDMDLLSEAAAWPDNGLLYVAHYGMGTGTSARGVELTNGSEISAGLTVVAEGSLYINGDYNTVNKKGAAVIADAVNLLSNSWDGTKSAGNLPVASNTTYNTAIVTGNTTTSEGSYNGGLENLPRFHEKWTTKKCTINGSFVNAWESQYANADWGYGGDIYKAPKRKWYYDEMFNDVENLPPYTPMVVSASDIVRW